MHEQYLAAVERLRRVESGDDPKEVYRLGPSMAMYEIGHDKALVYDAEHDDTPATVEWLREVVGEPTAKFGHTEIWRLTASVEVRIEGSLIRFMANIVSELCRNPTRGDVLTLLRVFSERKV